jgi:translation initiation factor IF-2
MEGRLSPEFTEELRGHAEIKRVFISSKLGNIAGCMVLDGKISRNDKIRLLRDDQVIWTGGLASVRREKDEVKDVREGFECGLLLKNYNDIKEGDVIEAFVVNEVKRTLGSA